MLRACSSWWRLGGLSHFRQVSGGSKNVPVKTAMAAGHSTFGKPHLVEIRPGRSVCVEVCPPVLAVKAGVPTKLGSILFLHGAMAHRRQFHSLSREFVEMGYTTVLYDALGCGDSHKPDDWSAYAEHELVLDAAEILRRFTEGRVLLIGHSFGANVAVQLACDSTYNKSIAGLVLLGTQATPPPVPTWLFFLPEWILDCCRQYMDQAFVERAFHSEAPRGLLAEAYADCDRNPWHVIRPFYRQLEWKATHLWSLITQPVLVIGGHADRITPPEGGRQVADTIPGAEYAEVEKAAHQIMQEQPQETLVLICNWLRRRGLV